VSRKSVLGQLSGEDRPEHRLAETCAAVALADSLGAELHRVHDVASTRAALAIARALHPATEGD
jgi:dihydropteroate synthase